MMKQMFAGARLALAIEPSGRLIRTSSPYVVGQRVTLADVSLDGLLSDDTLLGRLQAATSVEDKKAILKDVPDVRINLDPEISIEFAE